MGGTTVTSGSMAITWSPASRVASASFGPDTYLTGKEGSVLVEALTSWIGADNTPFALLADAEGVCGADAEYRSSAHAFFRQHRDDASIAVINAGAAIRVVADLFRIASGVQLKAFADEAKARSWLRTRGIVS